MSKEQHLREEQHHKVDLEDGSDEEEKRLQTAARMLAVAHAILFSGFYKGFVTDFLDPEFEERWEKENADADCVRSSLKIAVLTAITVALPWVYGHTIMDYPCDLTHRIMSSGSTDTKADVYLGNFDCHVEDWIRSPMSLLLGPLAAMIFGSCLFAGVLLDAACVACGCQPLAFKLRMFLRGLLYPTLVARAGKLFYYRAPMFFSLTASLYTLMNVEMIMVGVMLRSGVAVIIAFALSDIFLRSAAVLLAPPDECVAMLEGELSLWPCSPGLWPRVRQQTEGPRHTLFVSRSELEAVYGLVTLRELVEGRTESMSHLPGWRNSLGRRSKAPLVVYYDIYVQYWALLWVKKVYVVDDNRMILTEDVDDGSDETDTDG